MNTRHIHRFFFVVYLVMFACTLLVFFINARRTTGEETPYWGKPAVSFAQNWLDAQAQPVEPGTLNKEKDHPAGEWYEMYTDLPEELPADATLSFRSMYLRFSVLVGEQEIYNYGMEPEHVFGRSPGTCWHHIPLSAAYAGQQLTVRYATAYNASYECFADMELAGGAQLIVDAVRQGIVGLIASALLLFLGVVFMLVDLPANRIMQRPNHGLLYLGILAVVVGLWSLTETHVPDLFVTSQQALNVFSLMLLSLTPIPIGLFLFECLMIWKERLFYIGFALSGVEFVVCLILYMSGITDYMRTLFITQGLILYFLILTVYTVVINIRDQERSRLEKGLILSGISIMGVCVAVDLLLSKLSYHLDNARFTRVGMIFFILLFGVLNMLRAMTQVKENSQLELVSQLAYKDGLTGIGNRTAFNERLTALETMRQQIDPVSLVMLDVNNLKTANDKYGHQQGDLLIKGASGVINGAFAGLGTTYRIGGDEFAVVISSRTGSQGIESALRIMHKDTNRFNENGICAVPLSIAWGYACARSPEDPISRIMEEADEAMYARKREMKQSMGQAPVVR